MEPGDAQYPEPYFYVNAYPAPPTPRPTPLLEGGGEWNTDGWFGAILRGSNLKTNGVEQEVQVRSFLESANTACSSLLNE